MSRFLFAFAFLAGAAASADVRLVDAAGSLSSVGLLQVNTDAGFGSVCGANAAAADATPTEKAHAMEFSQPDSF